MSIACKLPLVYKVRLSQPLSDSILSGHLGPRANLGLTYVSWPASSVSLAFARDVVAHGVRVHIIPQLVRFTGNPHYACHADCRQHHLHYRCQQRCRLSCYKEGVRKDQAASMMRHKLSLCLLALVLAVMFAMAASSSVLQDPGEPASYTDACNA